ncbi:MAG: N-acetyl-gamma-glutamyl-phosphate reductase [Candidatus Dormibacteria bacterium]
MTVRAAIAGGAGYTGGELIRLLLGHPDAELVAVASASQRGRALHHVHPNLRGFTDLRFTDPESLPAADVVFMALPHGESARALSAHRPRATTIVDLSADFRLRDPGRHVRWVGSAHDGDDGPAEAVYGLPELHRGRMRGASLISGVGCSAAAAILGLMPLQRAGLTLAGPPVIEARFGSSAGGRAPNPGSHHPERSGAVRPFEPLAHRHAAELEQELGISPSHYAGLAVEMVRGLSLSAYCRLTDPIAEPELRRAYLDCFRDEPFVRVVAGRSGLHRLPDPRLLSGTNLCDVGFSLGGDGRELTVTAALDNLGKGAAGNAVQCMNVAFDLDERAGLGAIGLHPA